MRLDKVIFLLLGFAVSILLTRAQTPLVFWDFNESSGDANATGTAPFSLQLANGATRITGISGGVNDKAIDFGTNTSAKLTASAAASAALNNLSAITLCGWVRVSPARNPGWYWPETTIYDRTSNTNGLSWALREAGQGGFSARYAASGAAGWTTAQTSLFSDVMSLYDNGWVFVAMTLDGTTARFYAATSTGTDFTLAASVANTATNFAAPSGATLTIGGAFNGAVDNFRIYGSVLTQAQIKAVYDADVAVVAPNSAGPSDLASLRMGNIGAWGQATRGDTVPGVRMPFGSSYASPGTNNGYPSGYSNGKSVWGFSQLHVSGTGGDGKYGQFRMMPFKDTSGSTAAIRTIPNDSERSSTLEKLAVDAYEINLNSGGDQVKVEISPTHHGAKYRLTSLTVSSDITHVLIDAGYSIPGFVIEWDPSRQRGAKTGAFNVDSATGTMTGWGTYGGGWLGSVAGRPRWDTTGISDTTVYFAAKFSKTPVGGGTFIDKNPCLDGTSGRRTLLVGRKYLILDYKNFPDTDDFTNVGAASNATGTVFIATGTTPAAWSTNGSASSLTEVWTAGLLVAGRSYRIINYKSGDDFSNVGAAANSNGTIFTATGTTPTNWANGTVLCQHPWSNTIIPGGTSVATGSIGSGDRFGGYLSFATAPGEQITMDIAVSFTSVAQAQSYLGNELIGKTYDQIKAAARAAWDAKLGKITVQGGTDAQRRIFYSGLYRTLNAVADRTGDIPGLTPAEPLYDDHYATWDSWRTAFPLIGLVDEPVYRDNIKSFLNRWNNLHAPGKPLAGQALADAYIGGKSGYNWASRQKQGGDGPDFIMQESFLKGVPGVDYQAVLTAMRHSATLDDGNREMMGNTDVSPTKIDGMQDPPDFRWENGRPANGGGMSQMLEYQFNDYGLALVERGIGSPANQTTYANRSRFWENYFNYAANAGGQWTNSSVFGGDNTTYKGFIVSRNYDKASGTWTSWASAYPPVGTWNGSQLSGSAQAGYYEGNAAIYSFFVPHDMKTLIHLTRNSDGDTFAQRQVTFANRINAMMTFDRDHPNSNDFARLLNVGNEPSFLVLRQFNYGGRPDLASYWIRYVMDHEYSLRQFPGDEDGGAMGSMYVWSALGLCPSAGTDIYLLNGTCFTQAILQVSGGTLTINGTNASPTNIYVQSATLNGQSLTRAWLRHSEIVNGGTLTFVMGPNPSTWGQSEPPPMGRTFADWVQIYPFATSATTDGDGDGLNNFLEYALATNPGAATPDIEKPVGGTTTVGSTTYKTIAYNPSVAAISVNYIVEVSADGTTWTSGSGNTTVVRTGSPVIVRDNTAFSGSRHIRLRVTDGTNTSTFEPVATGYVLTVNNGTGGGIVVPNTVTNILADSPGAGQVFSAWTGATSGIANVSAPSTTITMPSTDITITATFTSGTQGTLNFNANAGQISVNGGTNTTGNGNVTIAPGYPVTLVATPAFANGFVAWTGPAEDLALLSSTTSATTTFTMPARTVSLTATYQSLPTYVLTINTGAGGSASGGSGAGNYIAGASVNITANTPVSGYRFGSWSGGGSALADASAASTTFTMPATATTLTTNYLALPLAPTGLAVSTAPNSRLSLTWSNSTPGTTVIVQRSANGSTGWTTLTTTAVNATSYTDTSVAIGETWYYRLYATNANGDSSFTATASATVVFSAALYLGTVFSSTSYDANVYPGSNAFDGDTASFFAALGSTNNWVGIDLGAGNTATVTSIKFFPRSGFSGRMAGGVFQGSNDGTNYTQLAAVSGTPGEGVWTTLTVNGAAAYRYLRYYNSGYGDVAEIQFLGGAAPGSAANPAFSPAAGTYSSTQSVTISSATSGASVRYTTDGSTPTSASGTVYSGAISVTTTTTLKAIAYKSGLADSAVVSAAYTITVPAVATPSFSPAAGSYTGAQSVSLSTATSGAAIRYTTDGSTPTSTTGTLYTGAISVGATTTLKAIAYKAGTPDSAVATAAYAISYLTALIDDGFADGNRTAQSLPASAAWYLRSANPPASSTSTSGVVVTPVTTGNPGYTLLAYFPNRTLGVGESLSASITVNSQAFNQLPTASRSQFRFGLFNSGTNTGDRFTADGNTTTINAGSVANGNFVNVNLLSASFGNATSTFFWNRTNTGGDGTSTSIFGAFVTNQGGEKQGSPVAPLSGLAGTNVVLSYTITNLDGTNATYDFKINGLTWTSATGTLVGTGTVFNTFAFQVLGDTNPPFGNALGTSQTFANLKLTTTTAQPLVPVGPSNLAAAAASASQINLTWTDNASSETGFKLERSLDGSTGWTQIATLAANATSASDAGLAAGTTYYYRLRATNVAGDSTFTAIASATTPSLWQSWLSANGLPADGSGNGADSADPDGDGLPNLLEYALGGSPVMPDAAVGPVVAVSGANQLQISFSCDASKTGVTYIVQASSDLVTWNAIASSTGGAPTMAVNASGASVSDTGSGVRTVTVIDSVALTVSTKRFIRLNIALP